MQIQVSRLTSGVTEPALRALCECFGEVVRIEIDSTPADGRAEAIITFATVLAADAAAAKLNGTRFQGRIVQVQLWRPADTCRPEFPFTPRDSEAPASAPHPAPKIWRHETPPAP